MRRWHAPLVWLLVMVACGQGTGCGLLPGASSARTAPTATIPAVRTDFVVAVKARGELEADQASPIAVPRVPTGVLKVKELAPEGSLVEKGDVIMAFDDSQLNIQLANHTATFRASGRQIDGTRIDRGIDADATMTQRAIAEMERDWAAEFQLEDDAIYSQLEILEASLDKSTAEERIIFADVKLLLKGEYYDIDEKILDVEKGQARDKMGRVETSLAQLVLTAPISGMVIYRKNWRGGTTTVGDTLWPGNVVMSIVDPTRTSLKVNVFEKDAAGVEEGAQAEVRIDAYMDRVFSGRVKSVSKLSRPIREGSPVKYFDAVVSLDEGDP
ncbi:MAG: efflux RND transporter periplasmic adaptor subunit, partial [Acidobacteria bacterium]|nr:efflux RND transporter periplasmic adaptor subunit [Acidobacteriota bacterium]